MIHRALNTNDDPIEVRVNVGDIPKGRTLDYGVWETYLYGKLKEAGIPVLPDGTLERGSMMRVDDPTDFGVTIYKWLP